MRVQYPKCAYGPYCKLNPIQNGVYILVEVSIHIHEMYLNIVSYLYRKQVKSRVRGKVAFMNDFHLCTLESA